jgi:putative sigma-54 modulation protein
MKISVTFRHLKPSDALRDYVEEKVGKVGKLLNGSSEAHVVLSVEKHISLAHIELITGGAFRVQAEDRSEDMYASIDLASEKLVKQLKRYRERVRDSHRETRGRELPHRVFRLPEPAAEASNLPPEKPTIIRQETIVAHEMTVDEAAEKMDLLSSDFLVFTDAENRHVSVMYRLPDGSFGLIEARPAA